MLRQGLILTSQREYAHAMRLGLLGLGDLNTRVDVELDAMRAMQLIPQQYDLIVLDSMLDSMDGLQLLQLMKQQAPMSKFVIVGDGGDKKLRDQAQRQGADLYLIRPHTPERFKIALDEIATLFGSGQEDQALSDENDGRIGQLADIVQGQCQDRGTVLLLVRSKSQSGDIFIYQGEVYHAQYPGKSGERAFHDMLQWDEGSVRVKELPLNHVPPRTIETLHQALLTKAAKGQAQPPDFQVATGELRLVAVERPSEAVPSVMIEAPPLKELWENPVIAEVPETSPINSEGTPLPQLNAHWKVNLMGELVEGSQVSESDRCAFITYFFYRKLADIAVALEVDYFNNMILFGPHLQQVIVADNMGIRHAVFDAPRTDEVDREQYVKWCCEQSF